MKIIGKIQKQDEINYLYHMPSLRNPFPIIKEITDLRTYEVQINQVIERFFNNFFANYEILSLNRAKNTFWQLSDETKEFYPNNWYDTFAVFIIRLITTQILLDEGRIIQESHNIFKNWFLYLSQRIIPNENHLSDDFLTRLSTDSLIPIPDLEAASSLLQENYSLIRSYDYPEIMHDDNISITERLRIFQVFYVGFYEAFKRKCVYIEQQLYQCEGRPYALHTLRDIFQLNNNNERTPPILPREALKVLIHIRNSVAHRNMIILANNLIRIRDYNNRNELTYEENRTIYQLNEFYHTLLVLDKGFDAIALTIMLKRRIDELYRLYGRFITCPDCGVTSYYCILPTMDLIICKDCRFPFTPP